MVSLFFFFFVFYCFYLQFYIFTYKKKETKKKGRHTHTQRSPYTKRGIEKIEKIQNRATKFILRSDDCYADRLKELNLLSLKKRRLLADLTFLYKALHGIIDIDVEPYVDFYKESDHYSFRHNDKLTLRMRYARTNVFKYSFFNRVVKTWNSLPLSIREATSVNTFKALVRKFFMD